MEVVAILQNVSVFGTGVLGSQIMMQAAYHGKHVIGYDISDELLSKLPDRWEWMRGHYQRDLSDFDAEIFNEAIASITTTTDIAVAVADADIVIEAIPENLQLKKSVWAEIGKNAPSRTIFATNTSTLRPSGFADVTGRPEKFLALHFANFIWKYNIGEVMTTGVTDQRCFELVLEFAAEIGLEPIPVLKETPEYIFNGLLGPFLQAAARLYIDGVADAASIDKVWRVGTGAPRGPFEIYDMVGFNVAYNIFRNKDDERLQQFAQLLKRGIESGKDGLTGRQGFYTYDNDGNRQQPVL